MEATFITITGVNYCYGLKPFKVGGVVKLIKDKTNEYDAEAIAVLMPYIEKVGYVANSPNTTFMGTNSAGRIYDRFDDFAYARIMIITHSSVIALVLPGEVNEVCENIFSEEDVIYF